MSKKKIFNDPVYGLISFPYEILYDLIDHPYFQRLRRISQVGLTYLVYPGAHHTRFHHALGACHLMTRAIGTLREKDIEITEEEAKGACIAILLHDIGHGPFSHALEGMIIARSHEDISLDFMMAMNEEFDHELSEGISIFKGTHPKRFLHELVSSQLDMDRLDYLNRDSYYTGVAEGVIGYDRIIKMLNVVNNQLVIEEKGIYSIEKFLMARRIMYWQVYLHKTSLAAELMLKMYLTEVKKLLQSGKINGFPENLNILLTDSLGIGPSQLLSTYAKIDDTDVIMSLKIMENFSKLNVKFLASSILKRDLFAVYLSPQAFTREEKEEKTQLVTASHSLPKEIFEAMVVSGKVSNLEYATNKEEIKILQKDGHVANYAAVSDYQRINQDSEKFFLCFPK